MEHNTERFRKIDKLSKAESNELIRDIVSEFELACREEKQRPSNNEDEDSRLSSIVSVVSEMIADSSSITPAVLDALASSRKEEVRYWATSFISEFINFDVDASIPIIEKLLDDDAKRIRAEVVRTVLLELEFNEDIPFPLRQLIARHLLQHR